MIRNILVALVLLSACEVTNTTPAYPPPQQSTITRAAACAETGQAFCARLTQCAAITVSDCLAQYLPDCCGADCATLVDAASSSTCAAGFVGFPCASLMASQVPATCH
jgi:hypothetical protein